MTYVYRDFRTYAGCFTVGIYDPEMKWIPESDHNTREEAAARTHYLNGGGTAPASNAGILKELKERRRVGDLMASVAYVIAGQEGLCAENRQRLTHLHQKWDAIQPYEGSSFRSVALSSSSESTEAKPTDGAQGGTENAL